MIILQADRHRGLLRPPLSHCDGDHDARSGKRCGLYGDAGEQTSLRGPIAIAKGRLRLRLFGYPAGVPAGSAFDARRFYPATVLDRQLAFIFSSELPEAATFDTGRFRNYVDLRVQLKDGVLRLLVPRERVTASNADIFVLWMIGSSLCSDHDRDAVPAQSGEADRAAGVCG